MLDDADLREAKITVSNDLDETIIETLINSGAPVDVWGVGTQMVTGGNDAAFCGVYKMAACENAEGQMTPVMKFSDNPEKTTNPGLKQVWRIQDNQGAAIVDVLTLDDIETLEPEQRYCFWHPSADYRHFYHVTEGALQPLLQKRLSNGEPCGPQPSLKEIRAHCEADLATFDATYKRLLNPHIYKVSITEKLRSLKLDLIGKRGN